MEVVRKQRCIMKALVPGMRVQLLSTGRRVRVIGVQECQGFGYDGGTMSKGNYAGIAQIRGGSRIETTYAQEGVTDELMTYGLMAPNRLVA